MGQTARAQQNGLKRLIGAFITPAHYDFWFRQLGSTHAWSRCFARVISRTSESDNTFTLRLAPNGNFSGFLPGQHVNVTTAIDGRRVTRSYSFSNVPNAKGWVEITVRHDPKGQMSDWLYRHAQPGMKVELERVFGEMTNASFSDHSVLMLAGGSGITPLMSFLREQVAKQMPLPTTLVYWERSKTSFAFEQELQGIADQFQNFSFHNVATEQQRKRRISQELLIGLGVDAKDKQVLACGASAFVDRARETVEPAAARFTSEAFTARAVALPDEAPRTFTVELQASNRLLEVSNQQSLLSELEQHGVVVQSGCRMGVCNTCSCTKVSGSTWNTESTETDSSTNSSVRLCISRATSNVQLAI